MDWITQPQTWISLITLIVLELVLGVDNVIFISILSAKLPLAQQGKARTVGLLLAILSRVLLLLSLSWLVGLEEPLFDVALPVIGHFAPSGRDLILLAGGIFLIAKSTHEIHDKLEGEEGHESTRVPATFASVVIQIMLLDVVFSLDSVITAVGMVDQLSIMVAAVIIAVIVMIFASKSISDFVDRHPTIKMLALSFLLLIGFTLMIEAFDVHVPKGYVYFAMAFSVFVELLNLRVRAKQTPVQLRQPDVEEKH